MTELQGLFERLVPLLNAAEIPFMIAGSVASGAHGLPRATQDIDIVIDPSTPQALDALLGAMPPDGYYVDHDAARDALRRRSMFNVVDHASGWKVDFILRKDRPFSREEFERRAPLVLLGVPVYDIAGIIATMGAELDRAYIERWVHELALEDEWREASKASV